MSESENARRNLRAADNVGLCQYAIIASDSRVSKSYVQKGRLYNRQMQVDQKLYYV
jgi:hypothetical protein